MELLRLGDEFDRLVAADVKTTVPMESLLGRAKWQPSKAVFAATAETDPSSCVTTGHISLDRYSCIDPSQRLSATRNMTQKVWLVTGCSSGLGKQLIQSIIARGDKVIATARNESALKALADAGAATIELDVTASEHVLKEKVQEAIGKFGRIDVVVHNAAKFQMGSW